MPKLQDRLLLVFVHGFRGTDTTFKDFPERLQAIASHVNDVHTIIYPRYKTAGDFQLAVSNLQTWVREQVKAQQSDMRFNDQEGKVLIVFLGHSMGGLVSAEVILQIKRCDPDFLGNAAIIGLLAYDTPFYSINHRFVSSTAATHVDTINRHVNRFMSSNPASNDPSASLARSAVAQITWPKTKKPTSSSSKGWGLLAGVVGVAAVGAAAYIAKDWIKSGMDDVFDHLEFVSTLMDFEGLHNRMQRLAELDTLLFRCFYIQLDNTKGFRSDPRTFIALPPAETAHYFIPIPSREEGEVEAHTSIFNANKNNHYYTLGLDSMALISEMMARQKRQQNFASQSS